MTDIDHTSFAVRDIVRSKKFYAAVTAPLGLRLVIEELSTPGNGAFEYVCFGTDHPCFCINMGGPTTPPVHLAFSAPNRAAVDAFYEAGLAAGGTDNGAPGIRAQYHPNYHAAFIRDPDGNNIEAVCHTVET